jgi:hypothetical protein
MKATFFMRQSTSSIEAGAAPSARCIANKLNIICEHFPEELRLFDQIEQLFKGEIDA